MNEEVKWYLIGEPCPKCSRLGWYRREHKKDFVFKKVRWVPTKHYKCSKCGWDNETEVRSTSGVHNKQE